MSLADGLMRLVKGVQGTGGIDAIMRALERKRQAEMQDELMQKLLGATQQNAARTQPANDGSFSAWGGLTTPEQKAQLGQQNKTPMSRVTGVQEIAKYLGQGGNPGVGSLMLGTLPKEPETHVLGKGQTIGKLDGNTFNALFTNPDTERTTKFDDPFEKAGEGYTKDGKFATYRNKYTGEEKTVRLGDTKEPTASTNINVNTGTTEIDVSKDEGEITRLLDNYKQLSKVQTDFRNKDQVEKDKRDTFSKLKGATDTYASKLQIAEDVGAIWQLMEKKGMNIKDAISTIDAYRQSKGEPALTSQQRYGITLYFKARNF